MRSRSDLEELWGRLEAELAERFRVFPDVPLNDAAMPEAEWPEPDVDGFLDFAASIGVSVVYAVAFRLDPAAASSELLGQGSERDDEEGLVARLRAYRGSIRSIEVAFVHQGVLHRWEEQAEWWRQLESMAETQDTGETTGSGRAFNRRAAPDADAAQIERWARLLAEDPGFQRAKTQTGREREARRVIPEVDRAILESKKGHSTLAWRVIQLALDFYWEDVVPRLDREMAPEARNLLALGLRKYQIAARLNISVDRLNRILELFPEHE